MKRRKREGRRVAIESGAMGYDVIIAGGSFAGLAVASRIRGRTLLIEPHEIGEHQTSACGTFLGVPQRLGLMNSVLQVHRELVIHTRPYTAVVDVSKNPFCTFDYRTFCQGMAAAVRGEILRARVLHLSGRKVITDKGAFVGEILVDASGWRAVLESRGVFHHQQRRMNFGIETVAPRSGDKLCFWFDPPGFPGGIGWFFPIDGESRIGVGTYLQDHHLASPFEAFLESLGLARAGTHGGYFPAGLQEPTQGNIFRVGDAAGQCLPLTGEGIRPAVYFGQACGSIVQRILDGEMGLEEGLKSYRSFVLRHRRLYRALGWAQRLVASLPPAIGAELLLWACRETPLSYTLPRYVGCFHSEKLSPLGKNEANGGRRDKGAEISAQAAA